MRICFDVDKDSTCSVFGKPYRNIVGSQGAEDAQTDITFFLQESEHVTHVIEFDGSATDLIRLFTNAADMVQKTLDYVKQSNGPKRPLPCPECDPFIVYPNATHKEGCRVRAYWEEKAQEAGVSMDAIKDEL